MLEIYITSYVIKKGGNRFAAHDACTMSNAHFDLDGKAYVLRDLGESSTHMSLSLQVNGN